MNGWLLLCTCTHSIKPIRHQKRKSPVSWCVLQINFKREEEEEEWSPEVWPQPPAERERERDLWHSLCHFRGEASLRWQLHLSSTPAPPHRCGPDERWSWQSWGTKICVMLWLLMPHWQILLRRGSSSRLKMITLDKSIIFTFNVNNKIYLFGAFIPYETNELIVFTALQLICSLICSFKL